MSKLLGTQPAGQKGQAGEGVQRSSASGCLKLQTRKQLGCQCVAQGKAGANDQFTACSSCQLSPIPHVTTPPRPGPYTHKGSPRCQSWPPAMPPEYSRRLTVSAAADGSHGADVSSCRPAAPVAGNCGGSDGGSAGSAGARLPVTDGMACVDGRRLRPVSALGAMPLDRPLRAPVGRRCAIR